MRVLFVLAPGAGHVYPTVTMAHALMAAGHEVLYAHGGDCDVVDGAGMPVVDVSPGVDYTEVFNPPGGDGTDPLHADLGMEFLVDLFARVSAQVVEGALRVARAWSPDLVMHVALQGAGPLVADALGVPCVTLPLGPDDSEPELVERLREAMEPYYREHGVTARPGSERRLTVMPPSLEDVAPGRRRDSDRPMRYIPYHGGGDVPEWLLGPGERPRIAVTLGSIEPLWGGIAVLEPFCRAVGDLDVEFVLTVGGGDLSLLGELPANVVPVDHVPLGPLLSTCSGVVHHGGSTTTTTAMSFGLPQCVIANGRGPRINQEALIAWGAGIGARAESVGVAECRALLEDEGLRAAAHGIREEMAVMPEPAALVPYLVDLTG